MRYGIDIEIQPFLFKVLGEFSLYKMANSIVSHILLNGKEIPTKAKYHDKTFYICYLFLCWALSNFVDPCWESYHAFKIKITYMPPNISTTPTLGVGAKTCLPLRSIQKCSTTTLGVNKNMFVRIHQNKCSKSLLISLSKVWLQKEEWVLTVVNNHYQPSIKYVCGHNCDHQQRSRGLN